MTAFHQMCDASKNLLDEEHLSGFSGAVLSPVNYTQDATRAFTTHLRLRRPGQFEFVFDPQLYFLRSERKVLREWRYFPKDFESSDRSSAHFWAGVAKAIAGTAMDLRARYVASPADVPKLYDNDYFVHLVEVGTALLDACEDRFEVMQSVIVPLKELDDATRPLKIASIISETTCKWVYLMLDTEREPRRELLDSNGITGIMKLIHALESAQLHVFVAYASSDNLLWKAAGASAAATGKYFNARRFSRSRFEEKKDGGGIVEYWFEESLLAFIRQDDLLRLHREKLLSEATLQNPLFSEVMESIKSGKAWLRLSWLQYLYWFADIDRRLGSLRTTADTLVQAADKKWSELDERNVIMFERGNNGEWIRRWMQSLFDFRKWLKTRPGPDDEGCNG